MVVLAQVSDLHLDGSERAHSRARRVFDYLRELAEPIDAVLVTGDIADHGAIAEYEAAAALFQLPFPVLPCPGNHDSRAEFRKVLLGEPAHDGPINRMSLVGGVAILMCDSTIPGLDDGLLERQTLSWIDSTLASLGAIPALLAFHHPPVLMRVPLPDTWPLRRPEELERLLAGHPNVIGVLTGHAHTPAAACFAGRSLIVAPATTWTMKMPWEHENAAWAGQPPGLAFHIVHERQLVTHFRVVP